MQIYLPIAEISVNLFLLLGLGAIVGFLSGLFGVGGGFLMTPLIMFVGISPAVAVATGANQIVASSVSGMMAHWRHRNVDIKMGAVLVAGGLVGSVLGVQIFALLREAGQINLVISMAYVAFLGIIGSLMLAESGRALIRGKSAASQARRRHRSWIHGLPFKMRFRKSKLYISAIAPFVIGIAVGVLAAIMGVGGGFVMVPAMIYLLGMPTAVVVGTSLFQIIFVMAAVTFLQAVQNQTVDIVLALPLLLGGVIGAQFGSRASGYLRGEQLRGLLALLVLGVGAKLAWDLVAVPEDLFSVAVLRPTP